MNRDVNWIGWLAFAMATTGMLVLSGVWSTEGQLPWIGLGQLPRLTMATARSEPAVTPTAWVRAPFPAMPAQRVTDRHAWPTLSPRDVILPAATPEPAWEEVHRQEYQPYAVGPFDALPAAPNPEQVNTINETAAQLAWRPQQIRRRFEPRFDAPRVCGDVPGFVVNYVETERGLVTERLTLREAGERNVHLYVVCRIWFTPRRQHAAYFASGAVVQGENPINFPTREVHEPTFRATQVYCVDGDPRCLQRAVDGGYQLVFRYAPLGQPQGDDRTIGIEVWRIPELQDLLANP